MNFLKVSQVFLGNLYGRLKSEAPNLDLILIALLLVWTCLLFFRLSEPDDSLIFDEVYYVQAARVIAGLPVTSEGLPQDWYSGGDPNAEHPPLAKLIMAAGIELFHTNATGWRLPSIVMGISSAYLIYALARQLNCNQSQARFACAVLAFDNLFFVHSRIATLDIYVVAFSLLGLWLYFRRDPEWAGIALGLATVCKISGLFTFFGIALFETLSFLRQPIDEMRRNWLSHWRPLTLHTLFYVTFFLSTLGALDCYWTEFRNPIQHVKHIVQFGTNLSREKGIGPQGIESTPLQWWLNEKSFDYLTVNLVKGENTLSDIHFRGIISPYLIASAPFVLCYCLIHGCRGNKAALLAFSLFASNYLPLLLTWLKVRRICYLYYMLPCLPALAIGLACTLKDCPLWVRVTFLLATLYSFVLFFPFKH